MITKEERNIFIDLHDQLEELGAKTSFQYGSYGTEFQSMIELNGTVLTQSLVFVSTPEDHKRIDDYRKLLIGIIQTRSMQGAA